MKKRVLSLTLAALLALSLLPMGAFAADSDFVIRDTGALTKYNGPGGAVTIPDSATSIGSQVFKNCENVTSVVIPGSVTYIASHAFEGCTNLTTVVLSEGVESIDQYAFSGCTSLTSVTIPSSVKYIRTSSFDDTPWLKAQGDFAVAHGRLFKYQGSATSVTIPNTVTSIGEHVFFNCDNMTSVTIPSSVTSIESYAFWDCDSLTSVTIPDSVTSLGHGTFEGCRNLKSVTIPGSVAAIADEGFSGCTSLTSLTISDGVTGLGSYAFYECNNLKSVTIPGTVTSIPNNVFEDCTSLTSVTIPSSVTSIGGLAFAGCSSLTDVYYGGSEGQWKAIKKIGSYNEPLTEANIHYTACASTQNVLVDGESVEFQCYALKDENGNDTNYIKLRDVASVLNGTAAQFDVGWNGAVNIETGKAYTPNGSEMSTPYSGNRTYENAASTTNVNGAAADLSAIVLKDDAGNGYTYYKLRDLGSALGFKVDWSAEKGIFIETK